MIIRSTLHNHCDMCDGRQPAADMIEAAIAAGFTDFGLSCHSYAPFDLDYSIKDEAAYLAELQRLRSLYDGRIRLAFGTEQDYYAPAAHREAYDYVIGSVHYFRDEEGRYQAVDGAADRAQETLEQLFAGDALAMAAAYFRTVVQMAREQRPDVIGHFDLIKKNNGRLHYLNEDDPAYRQLALEALEQTAAVGAIFEVNTAPIFKGLGVDVYPSPFLLTALRELGAPIMINADAHCTEQVTCGLEETARRLKKLGFGSVKMWQNGTFTDLTL